MRSRFPVVVLIGLLLLPSASSSAVAAKKMFMQAAFNPVQTEGGVLVAISGRVFETNNVSIPNAVISIQVNNPQGTSIHVAIAYSGPRGAFEDTFLIATSSPGGNYTAYLVAEKPGYDTARLSIFLAYSTPDFSIQSSSTNMSLRQGQTGSMTVTVLSLRGFNEPVNLTALDTPAEVTIQFNPSSIVPSGTAVVSVVVSNSAEAGNYSVTLLAVSGSVGHKTSFQLEVRAAPFKTDYVLIAVGLAVLAAGILSALLMRSRSQRRRREAALEELISSAEADTGYVATARVIARLEELRAIGKVDEATYQGLRREYEKRLEKSR